MKNLADELQKKLSKLYEVQMKFRGSDITFKTDEKGNPILLFIGTMNATGKIKGNRYTRVLRFDAKGNKIKDHWEMKGKAS